MDKDVKSTNETKKATANSSTALNFGNKVVEQILPLKPNPRYGNLCQVTIDSVKLEMSESPKVDDKGLPKKTDYAGYEIPVLTIVFKQIPTTEEPKDRYLVVRFSPISNTNREGEAVEESSVVSMYVQTFEQLQHICNAFKDVPGYSDEKAVPALDPKAHVENRIEMFKEFFEHFYEILVGTGDKPMYKNVPLWLKAVADYTTRSFYTIPKFIRRGFLERIVKGTNPSIYFETNESPELIAKKGKGKTEESAAAAPEASEALDPDLEKILQEYK